MWITQGIMICASHDILLGQLNREKRNGRSTQHVWGEMGHAFKMLIGIPDMEILKLRKLALDFKA